MEEWKVQALGLVGLLTGGELTGFRGKGGETESARRGVRCSVLRCGGAVDSPSPRGLTRTRAPAMATTGSRGETGSGQRAPRLRSSESR